MMQSSPSEGDVILSEFPYEDEPGTKSKRPCLVLAVSEDGAIAAKITTTELRQIWAYRLNSGAEDCSGGSIKYESWINLNRVEKIPISDCYYKLASLKKSVFADILERIRTLVDGGE